MFLLLTEERRQGLGVGHFLYQEKRRMGDRYQSSIFIIEGATTAVVPKEENCNRGTGGLRGDKK